MYNGEHCGKKGKIKRKDRNPFFSHKFKFILMFIFSLFYIHKFEIKIEPFFLENRYYIKHSYNGMLYLNPQNLAVFSRLIYPTEEKFVCGNNTISYEIKLKFLKLSKTKPNRTKPKAVYPSAVVLSF